MASSNLLAQPSIGNVLDGNPVERSAKQLRRRTSICRRLSQSRVGAATAIVVAEPLAIALLTGGNRFRARQRYR